MAATEDSTLAKLERLLELRDRALHEANEKAIARQRERGKLLARERLEKLLDPGTFVELDERARIEELLEALAREQLAALALARDRLLVRLVERAVPQLEQALELRQRRVLGCRHGETLT